MISDYQQGLREKFLSVPVIPPPAPWRRILDRRTPIGGLLGIGFALAPDDGRDLVMVVSVDGHGLFDAVTGEKIARDRDPEDSIPDAVWDLSCPGLGPLAATRVHIAGLFGAACTPPPRTAGPWRSLAPSGRITVSCCPKTEAYPTTDRTAKVGGTSSTPTTPNSGPPASHRPDALSPSPPAATSRSGHVRHPTQHLRARPARDARIKLGRSCLFCSDSEREVHVVDVRELDQEARGASAVVLEVDLLEAFGRDLPELGLGGAGVLGGEEAGRVLRGGAG